MSKDKVLVIGSNATRIEVQGGRFGPTGNYINETVVPMMALNQARPLRSVVEEGLDSYTAVFVPGGQGPVVDLMQDPDAGEILRHFHEASKPTALLCHGPIALVSALPHAREFRAALIAGAENKAKEWAKGWQYAGYKMTIFSASEEKWVENEILHAKMYFNMPYALKTAGGQVSTGAVDFEP